MVDIVKFHVVGPDGAQCTQRHPTSGAALDEATRHYRPRLVVRRGTRTRDWHEMQALGYRLTEEHCEPESAGDKVIELLIAGGYLDQSKADAARSIVNSTLSGAAP